MKARSSMNCLVYIVQGLLLLADATEDGDEMAGLVATAWFTDKEAGASFKQSDWTKQTTLT